jgi:hypothetical protein
MKLVILNLLLISFLPNRAFTSTSFNIESGQATNSFNKVRIDGDDGTLFNLRPALESILYYRLSFIKKFNSPHGVRLLYAPLRFTGDKRFSKDIDFNGVNFPAEDKTEAIYQFNSYRGTYFYEAVSQKNFFLRLGGTLKIRDALTELKQNDRKKAKKNIGLVPLFYLFSQYKLNNKFLVALDFDGLMAPQGRAFDVAVMTGYIFSPSLQLNLGVRMLEGGVDNEKVYNFSQINYYFTSMQINF